MLLAVVVASAGCYRNRNAAQGSKPYHPPPEPSIQLEPIAIDDRVPILIPDIGFEANGTPANPGDPISLRRLTVEQCRQLALAGSRNANALDAEQERLRCNENTPECIRQMMQCSAAHQRNESIGQALEVYLNLVEIYLQHDLLLQSKVLIEDTRKTIEDLRAADVVVDFDRRELDRKQLEADEKVFALMSNQRKLTTGLELLLQLQRTANSPIWTEYRAEIPRGF